MRFKIIIFIIIVSNTFVFSQAPGHLGKRFSLGYAFHTSPSVFNANAKNETILGRGGNSESGNVAFNAIHELSLEYATSSRWEICFSARYYKTICDNAEHISVDNGYNLQSSRPNGYYNIRGLTYTLYFKYYGKRYVAPWGRYVMFGPAINTSKTSYDSNIMNIKGAARNSFNYNYRDTLLSDFGPKEQNFVGVNLMMGMGRSRIIANRVILDYGVTIHVFSVISGLFDAGDIRFGGNKIAMNNYIESTVKQRVRGVNRFNAFLKVGILLF